MKGDKLQLPKQDVDELVEALKPQGKLALIDDPKS
ncbi:hypothetical protein PSYJA_47108, partial [Pseudomonas syringae pv. japonica str. M301072]